MSCLDCQENFYLVPFAQPWWSPRQRCLPCPFGASCVRDNSTTLFTGFRAETIVLNKYRWRLSAHAPETYECKTSGDEESIWTTPCLGGASAGVDGQGYCVEGHWGPLCELCNQTTTGEGSLNWTLWTRRGEQPPRKYFSESLAHCVDCPDMGERLSLLSGLAFAALLAFGVTILVLYKMRPPDYWRRLVMSGRRMVLLASSHALVPKLKILLALYQSIAAIPDVYNVRLSPFYYESTAAVDSFNINWDLLVFPGSCLQVGDSTLLTPYSLLRSLLLLCSLL